jgi:hypothetical protein
VQATVVHTLNIRGKPQKQSIQRQSTQVQLHGCKIDSSSSIRPQQSEQRCQ